MGEETCNQLATLHVNQTVAKVNHYRGACPPELLETYCLAEDLTQQLTEDRGINKLEKKVLKNMVQFQIKIRIFKKYILGNYEELLALLAGPVFIVYDLQKK